MTISRWSSACLVLGMLLAVPAVAKNVMPGDFGVEWLEPYAEDLGVAYNRPVTYLIDQSYVITQEVYTYDGGPNSVVPVTIPRFLENLQEGYGIWLISTHGSANGFAIQTYPISQVAERDTALVHLQNQFAGNTSVYQPGDFYASTTPSGTGCAISVKSAFIKRNYHDLRSLVINGSCEGHRWTSAWDAAEAALDFSGCPFNTTVKASAESVFVRMNGLRGVDKRILVDAMLGTPYSFNPTSNFELVLSPRVVSCTLAPNASVSSRMNIYVQFDAPMDFTAANGSVVGTGGLAIGRERSWSGDDELCFDIGPWKKGAGQLVLQSLDINRGQFNGFCGIDGQPLDGDGRGPNRDDYILPVTVAVDNPAASLSTFTAVRQDGGASVRWRVESQSGTDRYLLYRSSSTLGPWSYVSSLSADSTQWDYTIFDPGMMDAIYELREVEQQGDTLVLGQAELRDPFLVPFDPLPTVGLADSLRQIYWSGNGQHVLQPESILPIYDITYVLPVDPTGAWNNAIQPLVADRLSRGFLVNTITMDQVGNTREGLHNYFKQAYRYGLRGSTLSGSDEDSQSWNKYPWNFGWTQPNWVGHPEWALIPMWDWPDPIGVQLQSISWYRPGMTSDMPYGDVTGDSIPEFPVTRIPAMTPAALSVAVAKILAYERQDLSSGSYIVADQGRSLSGSSGSWASAMADTFAAMIPSSLQKIRLHDTDALPLTHAQALGLFLSACATNRVVGATFTGTVFNRNKFHWLNRTDGDSWSSLGNGQFLCAIAAPTCELAGTDRRVDPSFGPGLPAMSFNSFPNQGPAWIWASNNGSHQGANSDLGKSFFRYVYQVGCWSAAEAARAAVYDAAQHWYQKYQALGTEILGDVCSPFPGQILRTTSVNTDRSAAYSLRIARTINRSSIICQWSAPVGQSVRFHLYDLSGRSRMSPTTALGTGATLETALSTGQLAPGMYFLRLQAGNQALSAKCIILR